ncbi:hypothetical protein [Shewanella colwelliana]|nr:hypothetical protein [Shewanella colwelliana]
MRALAFASVGAAALALLAWRIWPLSTGRATDATTVTPKPVNPVTSGLDYLNFDFNKLLSGDSNMTQKKPTTKPYEQAGGSPIPRGIANNNPLNIRENAQVDYDWNGEHAQDLDASFEEFTTPFWGIRAAARIMRNYDRKYGFNTIETIINRWAPPEDDNHTENYIAFVANKAGVHPQSTLSAADYPKVVAAMIHFENGYNPYDQATIEQAVIAGLE